MREIKGTGNRILTVDLSSGRSEVLEIDGDLRSRFLGGKGLGVALLAQRLPDGCDPLGPENLLAVMPGVLMGTGAPCSGRFEAMALSPLTGILGTSSCGGPFGMALKTAGWDGLLISGQAPRPSLLYVDQDGAELRDAGDLWGKEIPEVQAALDHKRVASLVIGPAGENLVRFANIATGSRFLGRGGLGAVMGSKRLKAVVAAGGAFKILPVDPEAFAHTKERATAYIKRNSMTGQTYRRYGTNANVLPNQAARILPVRNFAAGSHPQAERLSGQALAAAHDTKHHTCRPCTILCGHKGRFAGGVMPVPEYETVGLLGASLGVFDPEAIARWNAVCGRLGLDTISAGGTLAWVMEAAERGLVDSPLRFGSPEGVEQALFDIAGMSGPGAEMALGSRELARRHGGAEFAMQVKGLELAAYDPRGSFGLGLAYATANRGGCHLSAYLVAQEVYFGLLNPRSTRGKARWVKFFEDLTCCVNSLQTCQFTMFAYLLEPPLARLTPDPLLGAMMQHLPWAAVHMVDFSIYRDLWRAVTGATMGLGEFLRAGERIHVLERLLNLRQGLDPAEDTLPPRLLQEPRADDERGLTVPLAGMLAAYYRRRGYDAEGRPTPATLRRLGL